MNVSFCQQYFPDNTIDIRRLIEKQPLLEKPGLRERKIALLQAGFCLAKTCLVPSYQLLKTVLLISMLGLNVIGLVFNENPPADLKLRVAQILDSLINIPISSCSNFLQIFKHTLGCVVSPSLCFREAKEGERGILMRFAEAKIRVNRYYEFLQDPTINALVRSKDINELERTHPEAATEVIFFTQQFPSILEEYEHYMHYWAI